MEEINLGKYIKNLYSRDKDVFFAFNKVGNLNQQHLNQLGLSNSRIKNYCREGYLKKVEYKIKGSKENGIAYKLTDKGKEIGTSKFGLTLYAQNTSVRHNMDLADKYIKLSENERMTILNEREVRELVQAKIVNLEQVQDRDRYQEMLEQGKMSMPDIVYVSEQGTMIAYETITNNYGENEIQAKVETCEFLKIEYQFNKI